MTQNQIAVRNLRNEERKADELERSNRAKELETKRSNLEKEFQEYGLNASGMAKDWHWGSYRSDDSNYGSDKLANQFKNVWQWTAGRLGEIFPFKISGSMKL